jgi:cytochrome c peroxidase
LIQDAFQPEWWRSNVVIRVDPKTGQRTFLRKPKRRLSTIEYTQMEYNFSLFFGLAVQAYESTLVSAETPFDQFLAGNTSALTAQQQQGWTIFQNNACIGCHAGSELTAASVSSVAQRGRIARAPIPGNPAEDTGFFRIGVRPNNEDPGLGGLDRNDKDESGNPLGNPLSEVRLAQQGKFKQLLGEDPPTLNPPLSPTETVVADGAFKAPGLRNVELTAPYFHNGGQATLEQVVDFYSRGGDFGGLPVLNLTSDQKQALVAFLKGLTDERVRNQKAPFDHPQLFVPNGHPGNQNSVTIDPNVKTNDGTTQATDALLEIPAVGRNGGNPLPNFLATS